MVEATVVGMELVSESGLVFVRVRAETSYAGYPKGTDVKAATEFFVLKHEVPVGLTLGDAVTITIARAGKP